MVLFVAGKLMAALTTNWTLLLASRILGGLTQGAVLRLRRGRRHLGLGPDLRVSRPQPAGPPSHHGAGLGWVHARLRIIALLAEQVAGFDRASLIWVLVIVGLGLLIGNRLGGRTADANLRLSLIGRSAAMIAALLIVGLVAAHSWTLLAASLVFGGILGGTTVGSHLGAAAIPVAAGVVPVAGFLFILGQERRP